MRHVLTLLRLVFLAALLVWSGAVSAQTDEGVLFTLGRADAPVEVIEVVSLGCPTCRSFHRGGIFDGFRREYVDTGQVRWVVRDHFWTKFDFWTSRIVRCGDPGGRAARMDHVLDRLLFIRRDDDPQRVVNRLVEVAGEMKISRDAANACLQDAEGAERQLAAHRAFLNSYRLQGNPAFGTPFFIVAGQPFWIKDNRVDYDGLNTLIKERVRATK